MRMMTFRLEDEDAEHLDALSAMAGVSRTEYLRGLVRHEWDAYSDNPALQQLVKKLTDVQVEMQQYLESLGKVN